MSLARLSLVTAKARCLPGPSFPLSLNRPIPNATALADARGTYIVKHEFEGNMTEKLTRN